uniref:Integrase catalytic domain-containing protein n=1 Tax=Trichuris muris TaxID=70415 RepID=A0A5S6QQB5_TRIMR
MAGGGASGLNGIQGNNGTSFDSANFRQFCSANRIRFLRVAPYHPASNGLVEKVVQTTKQALRTMDSDKWATGLSPAEILLRRRPKSLLDSLHPDFFAETKKTQEEDAVNLEADNSRRTRTLQVGERIELPQDELRIRRSIDHLRTRGFRGPPSTQNVDEAIPGISMWLTPQLNSQAPDGNIQPATGGPDTEFLEQETPMICTEQVADPSVPATNSHQKIREPPTESEQRSTRRTQRPRYLDDYVT